MSKHTPGPWLQSGTMIMAQQRRHLMVAHCTVTYVSGSNWTVEIDSNEASENARLIAAAPDLLEALRSFMRYGCPVCGGDCGSANPPVMSCPVQAGYAAISKAEGRQ